MTTDLSASLGRWLTEQESRPVEVRSLELASAGARRLNALFETVHHEGGAEVVTHLALTMIPRPPSRSSTSRVKPPSATSPRRRGCRCPTCTTCAPTNRCWAVRSSSAPPWPARPVPRRVLRLVHGAGIGDRVVDQLGAAMAHLHGIDPADAPPELMAPSAPIAAALLGIDQGLSTLLDPSPTFSFGMRWLERHVPSEPATMTIVHSDIRTGNIIVGDDGLRAILDWETARIGDPMEDLAWPCQRMWRFRDDQHTAAGMSSIATLRAGYVNGGGTWDEDRFDWWRVLGTVRWGLGLAGQARQHLDGSFPSIVMAASGRRVPELEYDTLLLLRNR